VLEVAAEAAAGPGHKGANAKRVVGDVAVDSVAAWRRDAHPMRPAAAGAHNTHLEPPRHRPPVRPLSMNVFLSLGIHAASAVT
jgi:hypothetical protein